MLSLASNRVPAAPISPLTKRLAIAHLKTFLSADYAWDAKISNAGRNTSSFLVTSALSTQDYHVVERYR
jgi:hypothetical protein